MARTSLIACFFALCSMAARADDWSQFRHDAQHSATSADKLTFPLKESWQWNTRGPSMHSPLFHAAIWHDQVFFTASYGVQRHLVCADVKTGKVKWHKALETERLAFSISDIVGPAVSENGTVFVYDWMTGKGVSAHASSSFIPQVVSSSGEVEPINSFCVRTFRAKDGEEGGLFPLAAMGANGVLPRLSLTETEEGQEVHPVPATFVGCPP